jgi:two-component system response regulator RegA
MKSKDKAQNQQQSFIVIDDDDVFNRILCRAITRQGMQTYSALNSAQAIKIVNHYKPDCAVLDLNLITENGIDLIQPLLHKHPTLKIVVLTGYASLTTAVQAIKLGAWNYLAKPIDTLAILKAFNNEDNVLTNKPLIPISLKQMEWEHLQRVLAENKGNITLTARQLGMHRRTLQRKLKKKNTPVYNEFC